MNVELQTQGAADRKAQAQRICQPVSTGFAGLGAVKSHGRLDIDLIERGGGTHLAREHQSGCLRSRLLNKRSCEPLTIATINTAGGLTSGDSLRQSYRWRNGAVARITTPAAEKIYRSSNGPTRIETNLRIDAQASAEFLPQETIVFNGAEFDRSLMIDLEQGSSLLFCDAVVYGRHAREEEFGDGSFTDTIRVRRNGRLVLFDRTKVGEPSRWRAGSSTLGRAQASGAVLFAAPECGERLVSAQSATEQARGLAGASLVRGLIHIRLLAFGDEDLRHDLALMLKACQPNLVLPRNWSC